MPGQDGKGPRGSGPMTGWGSGWCIRKAEGVLTERETSSGLLKSRTTSTGRRRSSQRLPATNGDDMTEQMLLAVPSDAEGGLQAQRSGHFGQCDCFTLVRVAKGVIDEVTTVENPPHVQGGCLSPVELLASHGVTHLVAAGMGARPLMGFRRVGIQVLFEQQTPAVGEVVKLALTGRLPLMDDRSVCGGH
jgi:predicted Fe-Mo cluster-binding NifX family protein